MEIDLKKLQQKHPITLILIFLKVVLKLKQELAAEKQEVKELKAVCFSYDTCINKLPKDVLVLFSNLTPPEFLKGIQLLNELKEQENK